jgi:hypothetical protein
MVTKKRQKNRQSTPSTPFRVYLWAIDSFPLRGIPTKKPAPIGAGDLNYR